MAAQEFHVQEESRRDQLIAIASSLFFLAAIAVALWTRPEFRTAFGCALSAAARFFPGTAAARAGGRRGTGRGARRYGFLDARPPGDPSALRTGDDADGRGLCGVAASFSAPADGRQARPYCGEGDQIACAQP